MQGFQRDSSKEFVVQLNLPGRPWEEFPEVIGWCDDGHPVIISQGLPVDATTLVEFAQVIDRFDMQKILIQRSQNRRTAA